MKEDNTVKKFYMFLAAFSMIAVLQLACTDSNSEGNEADRFFLGLWEGIDPLDGSTVLVSFTNLDKDDTIELAWTESLFSLCDGGPGLNTGIGTVGEDGILLADEMFTCFNTEETFEGSGAYEPVKEDGIIIATSPANPELPAIVLHKVSNNI